MKKTIIYSSLAGGMAGATAGALLSPDKESQGANAAIFGVVGAGVAALAGYSLYEDDPRNKKLNHMLDIEGESTNPNQLDLDLGELKIEANLSKDETYRVPSKELPEALKGKVKEQYLIKYQSKEKYINQGEKTFYIPEFEIYEHSYSEIGGNDE
ncbi:MAG: hypothetical protein WEB87_05100 [Bacteriovoracaceae bacterium]